MCHGLPPLPLRRLECYVLIRSGVREACNLAKPRLPDPRAHTIDEPELPDRCKDRPLVNELLHLVQDCLALLLIELGCLLLEQRVDLRIAARDIGPAFDDECIQPGRGVAEGAAAGLDDAMEFLAGMSLEEGSPLERTQLAADAHGLEIVEHRLANIRIGSVAIICAGVKAVGMAGL